MKLGGRREELLLGRLVHMIRVRIEAEYALDLGRDSRHFARSLALPHNVHFYLYLLYLSIEVATDLGWTSVLDGLWKRSVEALYIYFAVIIILRMS